MNETTQTQTDLLLKTHEYVKQQMSRYDCSHDIAHVDRVVDMALYIAREENAHQQDNRPSYNTIVVNLAALLHDIGDRKYLPAATSTVGASKLVHDFLISSGASDSLTKSVPAIVSAVSYSSEMKEPEHVARVLAQYPELGPVQDADRLDAVGAVGIARCFAFQGARSADGTKIVSDDDNDGRRVRGHVQEKRIVEARDEEGGGTGFTLATGIRHFDEKLLRLERTMKTECGRRMAAERSRRMFEFKQWWGEESRYCKETDE